MELFRKKAIMRLLTLFTGVIFLNMSFFLAEVCMLDFKDRQVIENVCNLLLNAGLEEERDGHSSGSDVPMKVFPMASDDMLSHHASLFLIAVRIYHTCEDPYLHADHSEIFSPPPEFFSPFS